MGRPTDDIMIQARRTFTEYGIDHLGIETTTRCNLTCLMCPRTESRMPAVDLSFAVFERLLDLIPPGSLVDLNGWGEPLLHPRLIDMVREIKTRGSFPGFSTNGLLLVEDQAEALLDAGVDYVAFSVDGASPATYRRVRNASFEKVCDHIGRFVALRGNQQLPQLSLTFVMLRDNLEQVPDIVFLASELGVDFVRLKKVDIFTPEDYRQITYDFQAPYDPEASTTRGQTEMLARAVTLGEQLGIGVQVPRLAAPNLPYCWMEPEHTVFVNSLGQFAPCCVLGHSTIRLNPRLEVLRFPSWTFGNITDGRESGQFDLKRYQDFMDSVLEKRVPDPCVACPKITPSAQVSERS